jgi:hypothetical protein
VALYFSLRVQPFALLRPQAKQNARSVPCLLQQSCLGSLRHSQPRLRFSPTAERRGNLYPTKQRPEQKIDAAVALMMAVCRAMAANPVSSYNSPATREFLLV